MTVSVVAICIVLVTVFLILFVSPFILSSWISQAQEQYEQCLRSEPKPSEAIPSEATFS